MAFQVTTASSKEDVISQIMAFAVANAGFTDQSGVGRSRLKKGDIYWSFAASTYSSRHHILARMSYTVSNTADPTATNGQRNWTEMSLWEFAGPYPNLYLFTEGTCVFAALEVTTGVFAHLSFGNIVKLDTFTGGEFVAGGMFDYGTKIGSPSVWNYQDNNTNKNACMFTGGRNSKGDINNSALRWVRPTGQTNNEGDFGHFGYNANSNQPIGDTYNGFTQELFDRTPNSATSRSILLPINIYNYDYALNNGLLHLTGYVPGIRFVNMRLLDPAEVIMNDWQCFPFVAKSSDKLNYPLTSNYGYAFKRIA